MGGIGEANGIWFRPPLETIPAKVVGVFCSGVTTGWVQMGLD